MQLYRFICISPEITVVYIDAETLHSTGVK